MLRNKEIGEIYSNVETCENDNAFFYIDLEYDRPNLDRFLSKGPNILLVWPLCGEFTGDRRIPGTNGQ